MIAVDIGASQFWQLRAVINNAAKRESAAFKDRAVPPKLAEAYVGPAIIEFLVSKRGT